MRVITGTVKEDVDEDLDFDTHDREQNVDKQKKSWKRKICHKKEG